MTHVKAFVQKKSVDAHILITLIWILSIHQMLLHKHLESMPAQVHTVIEPTEGHIKY